MKYTLDCEFNSFGGELISLALVRDDGEYRYYVFGCDNPHAWVAENVMPILYTAKPSHDELTISIADARTDLTMFLIQDKEPIIISDWPDDIRYFCELIITGPGTMVPLGFLQFAMVRTQSYPTTLLGAVQHNAYHDAMALREKLTNG